MDRRGGDENWILHGEVLPSETSDQLRMILKGLYASVTARRDGGRGLTEQQAQEVVQEILAEDKHDGTYSGV